MRVLCLSNLGSSLPEATWRFGESAETEFTPLKVGSEYIVYGLKFRANSIDYLVCDGSQGPSWKPGRLFTVLDSITPPWHVCITAEQAGYAALNDNYGITALIGYEALVKDPSHYDGILDRDPDQLYRFFVQKTWMDSFSQ